MENARTANRGVAANREAARKTDSLAACSLAQNPLAQNPLAQNPLAQNPLAQSPTADAAPSASIDSSTAAPWRQWLAGGSPREVLARIVHEDPLGVRDHVARNLRSGAWLLDADRVLLRTFALVARHALRYRGRPEVDEWISALAGEAIASILREDGEAERRPAVPGQEPGREHGAAFAALARPLGLEPEAMGRACLAFNRLPAAERNAFFALVIAGQTLDELARETGESATDIARRARRALEAILGGAQPAVAVRAVAAGEARAGPGRRSTPGSDRDGEKNDGEKNDGDKSRPAALP